MITAGLVFFLVERVTSLRVFLIDFLFVPPPCPTCQGVRHVKSVRGTGTYTEIGRFDPSSWHIQSGSRLNEGTCVTSDQWATLGLDGFDEGVFSEFRPDVQTITCKKALNVQVEPGDEISMVIDIRGQIGSMEYAP